MRLSGALCSLVEGSLSVVGVGGERAKESVKNSPKSIVMAAAESTSSGGSSCLKVEAAAAVGSTSPMMDPHRRRSVHFDACPATLIVQAPDSRIAWSTS